jgi:lipopolysaccharide assembly outer membrane protein LptD (OstA)
MFFIFLTFTGAYAQRDSTLHFPIDTLAVKKDTSVSKIDTTRQAVSDINYVINYTAKDSAVFEVNEQKVFLYNNATLDYNDLSLKAGIIVIDRQSQLLESYGFPDTVNRGRFVQNPLMKQGSDKYEGNKLTYNFHTKQGTISMGISDAEVGYYLGEKIKKVTPEVYFIKNGLYTTSTDKIEPEYYFFSPKMKIIPKDKVIAQSVFLYIEGVPVFWIPFAVFPDRAGRSSGLIMPTYGNDSRYGVYFSKFGYFWAANDYFDIAGTGSYFLKGRVDGNARLRYALRYKLSGNIDAGFSHIRVGEANDPDKFSSDEWAINITHNQTINPTTTLNGNLSFLSGKSYYDNSSNNLNDLLRQNAVSNLTLSKYWEEKPFSLTLNFYRDQNLQNGDVRQSFPSVLFNVSETYPFRKGYTASKGAKLYEYISYSYNVSGRYDFTRTTLVNALGQDSIVRDERQGIQQNLNIKFTPQFSNFTIYPYINYTELWYPESIRKTFNPADSSVSVENVRGFKTARYFQMGVTLNTKLIGIFNTKIFGIKGIRHTLTPSITYNYKPDFSSDFWGYYDKYTDASGNAVKYSRFEREIYGSPSAGESQSLSFNLGNIFEMKTRQTDTSDNKFQLFNLNAGINYNFAADSLKWSELRTDFRTQIGGLLNIGGGATFNLYKFDKTVNSRVNTFLLSSEGRLADLTSFNVNISTSFNFGFASKAAKVDSSRVTPLDYPDIKYNIPFTGSLNFNFSETKPAPDLIFRNANFSGSIAFSLTEKWKFTFSSSYDLVNHQISAPYFTAYRDLKSWEMNFNWYPTGYYRGFRLEIRIKAPQLNDIKFTKQTNYRGVY